MNTRTVNSVELALIDRGTGPAVVLVHGFPLDHSIWNEQIDVLAADHRVIAPDLRGFGRSGVTDDDTITMQRLADDLAGLLDALELHEPIVFCGLSMGGYVAFEFQRKYGDRLRGLILCDTRAAGDTAEKAVGRREMAERVLREGPEPLVDAMTPLLFAPETVANRPELVESLLRVMRGTDRRTIAAGLRGMADRPNATSALPTIDCPTLVLAGRFDVLTPPEEMREIAAAIPAAHYVEIPAAGHISPMENPAEVNAAMLTFLAGL
ncbi:MAG: alpha/beta fold hydrolase [Candidatus Nealsonbacteria bacterium]|nr:alpha/beta fold hydrolase [Candidatus Nealsonbacteria bacterium]